MEEQQEDTLLLCVNSVLDGRGKASMILSFRGNCHYSCDILGLYID